MTTLGALLSAAVATDPTRPLVTYYDDGTGERAELSGATLANWVAKTANLVVDSVGAQPQEVALVRVPPHWQTAAVLLGCWSAGLIVTTVPLPSGVSVAFLGTDVPDAAPDPAVAGERYVLGLRPLGMPLPLDQIPAGCVDFNSEVRGHGDRFVPIVPARDNMPAVPGSTHGELVDRAAARAAELGIGAGDRVLVDAARYPDDLDWLLAPLAAGASIVLCGHLDPARLAARAAAERVTVTLADPGSAKGL
ncbi:MAG: hypothetical protein V7603_4843 [Micromonosporaceae bacterium]